MKILKIIVIALLINSSLFSQSIDSLSKNTKRKMLKIELVNTEGSKFKGVFISSDKEKTIFYNEGLNNFYSIANNDIYKLKLSNKQSFGKSFGNNMIGAAMITTAAMMPMFDGEAIMIPPSFIIGVATTIFGIPASLITSSLSRNKDIINIEYIIDENNKIDIVKPILDKNNQSAFLNKEPEIKNIESERNIMSLNKIRKPLLKAHPLYVNRFHFSAGTGIVFSNITKQFKANLSNSDFSNGIGTRNDYNPYAMSVNLRLSMKVKVNIRTYLSYNSSSEFIQASGQTDTEDRLYINNSFSTLGFGAEYVFKPVKRVFAKKYEFGLNVGLSNNFYDYKIWYTSEYLKNTPSEYYLAIVEEQKYNIPSVEFGANASYFISRNIAFQTSITGSMMMPYEMAKMESFSVTNEPVSSGDLKVNIFSITPVLSISYSF